MVRHSSCFTYLVVRYLLCETELLNFNNIRNKRVDLKADNVILSCDKILYQFLPINFLPYSYETLSVFGIFWIISFSCRMPHLLLPVVGW